VNVFFMVWLLLGGLERADLARAVALNIPVSV
jgi:hypothetical protein